MKKTAPLYFSNFIKYENCPQAFLWSSGWGDIDLGRGPGRGKQTPEKDSRHHALMGIAIQKGVEDLYNLELWKDPVGLPQRLVDRVEKEFCLELEKNYVDWNEAPSKAEMLTVCRNGILGFLKTMKANKLLGEYAKAEVELFGMVNKTTSIGGRADTIIRRADTGTLILDGKNSGTKGKYTDPDQLRWYALCYYLIYSQLPERLAFVYYRFPHDVVAGESGMDFVQCTKEDIKSLAHRAVAARDGMEKEIFPATPKPPICKFCDFESICPERIAQKATNSAKRGGGGGAKTGGKLAIIGTGETVEFGFGDT